MITITKEPRCEMALSLLVQAAVDKTELYMICHVSSDPSVLRVISILRDAPCWSNWRHGIERAESSHHAGSSCEVLGRIT